MPGLLTGLTLGVVLTLGLFSALFAWNPRVVARWDAPGGVYHALVLDEGLDSRGFPLQLLFGGPQRYALSLGREAEQPTYGHLLTLPDLSGLYGLPPQQWQQSRVEWTARGARVTFWTGHEVFVPARAYEGGR